MKPPEAMLMFMSMLLLRAMLGSMGVLKPEAMLLSMTILLPKAIRDVGDLFYLMKPC